MAALEIKKNTQGEKVVYTLHGELTAETANELRQELKDALDAGIVREIRVSLVSLGRIGTTGVGVLLGSYKRSLDREVDLLFLLPEQGQVREMLQRLQVDTILPTVVCK